MLAVASDMAAELAQARRDRAKAVRIVQEAMKLMTDEQLLQLKRVVEGQE